MNPRTTSTPFATLIRKRRQRSWMVVISALGLVSACRSNQEVPPPPKVDTSASQAVTVASNRSNASEPSECLNACSVFVKRRAECSDLFLKDLKLPPEMLTKVKANHQRDIDGRECPHACGKRGETAAQHMIENGHCASHTSCEDFYACVKKVAK